MWGREAGRTIQGSAIDTATSFGSIALASRPHLLFKNFLLAVIDLSTVTPQLIRIDRSPMLRRRPGVSQRPLFLHHHRLRRIPLVAFALGPSRVLWIFTPYTPRPLGGGGAGIGVILLALRLESAWLLEFDARQSSPHRANVKADCYGVKWCPVTENRFFHGVSRSRLTALHAARTHSSAPPLTPLAALRRWKDRTGSTFTTAPTILEFSQQR
ncbi:hypothetical protein B0H16DRAFT_1474749 [Mycena metata]|uniref:Uncharacterized protein n=1 Tax=Mycena metata TaxID=1033252 RepID=A0AAD7HGN0_9AGAR|nr:hypothetical protein B0H16DRAFT_1474749 [Mycena metata]